MDRDRSHGVRWPPVTVSHGRCAHINLCVRRTLFDGLTGELIELPEIARNTHPRGVFPEFKRVPGSQPRANQGLLIHRSDCRFANTRRV
jgi:hypothetical protein